MSGGRLISRVRMFGSDCEASATPSCQCALPTCSRPAIVAADAARDDPHRPGDRRPHVGEVHHLGVGHRQAQIDLRSAPGRDAGEVDEAAAADAAAVGCSPGRSFQVASREPEKRPRAADVPDIAAGERALHAQRISGQRARAPAGSERTGHVSGDPARFR
jgi:hypothetical protein